MGGIAGIIDSERGIADLAATTQLMLATLTRRDQDHRRIDSAAGASLGYCRAGTVEPAPVLPPPGGNLRLVFDGYLSNNDHLRATLSGLGHHILSTSDTDVALHAFAQWGADALRQLEGAFAVACWNPVTGELILARDRFGIKPLYYAATRNGIVFASEIKAILAAGVPAELDQTGVTDLVTTAPLSSPGSALFRHLTCLPPATMLRRTAHRSTTIRYWALPVAHQAEPQDQTVHRAEILFAESLAGLRPTGADARILGDDPATWDTSSPNGDFAAELVHALELTDLPSLPTEDILVARALAGIGEDPLVLSTTGAAHVLRGHQWAHGPGPGRPHWPWHLEIPSLVSLLNQGTIAEANPDSHVLKHLQDAHDRNSWDGRQRGQRRAAIWIAMQCHLPYVLHRLDRAADTHGTTLRMPFLDRRLAEHLAASSAVTVTGPVRCALHAMLPSPPPPAGDRSSLDAQFQKPLWAMVNDLLADGAAPVWTLADPAKVRLALDRGGRGTIRQLGLLLSVDTWLRRYRVGFR